MTLSRTARSFLIAGLIAPVLGGVWSGVFFSVLMAVSGGAYQWPPTFLQIVALTSLYSAAIALILTWTVGLAWHILASAMGWRNVAAYVSFGAGVSTVIGVGLMVLANSASTPSALILVLWLGTTGGIIAYIGWLVRRPDRDPPPPPTSPT